MPHYALFNTSNDKYLSHPKIGLWNTNDIKEAEEMLTAAKEYVSAIGLSHLADLLIIRELQGESKTEKVFLNIKENNENN